MLWFFFCVLVLLLGYFVYSKIIEKIFVINPNRQTPAYQVNDGVDYMPMSKTKIWLIQLLNIAGTVRVPVRFSVRFLVRYTDLWRCYGSLSVVFLPVQCMTIFAVC